MLTLYGECGPLKVSFSDVRWALLVSEEAFKALSLGLNQRQ